MEVIGGEKFTELYKKLKAAGKDADKAVNDGLRLGAMAIQAAAKLNIRSVGAYDTGQLFRSISHEEIENGYAVGTNVEYAPYVEYGTGTLGSDKVAHSQRENWSYMGLDGQWHRAKAQPPRPYLRPAFDNHKEEVISIVKRKLREALGVD